jgi:hypothetical protein
MTSRALALGVAGGAQIALRIGLNPVLAKEVSVMHQVALRRAAFGRQLDVATVAVAHVPLSCVLMAAEAGRHVRAQRSIFEGHVDVAANAVAGSGFLMCGMRKPQVFPGHLRGVTSSRTAVAIGAGVGVVRILVAANAVFGRRKMKRTGFAGFLNADVAHGAVDAIEHVGPVLERALLAIALTLQSENLGARPRGASQGRQCHDCDQPFRHFFGHCPW